MPIVVSMVLVKLYLRKFTLFEYYLILLLVKPVHTFDKSPEAHQWNVNQAFQMKIAPVKIT